MRQRMMVLSCLMLGCLVFSGCIKKLPFFKHKVEQKQVQTTAVQTKSIAPFSFEFTGFDYKSWDLWPIMSQLMASQTSMTQRMHEVKENNTIKVFGYADRTGPENPEGDKMGNIALSLKRANAVVNFLNTKYGISADLFKVIGMGSSELKDSDRPKDKVNRRVVVEYGR